MGWPCLIFANLIPVAGAAEHSLTVYLCKVWRELVCAGNCFLPRGLPKLVCCEEHQKPAATIPRGNIGLTASSANISLCLALVLTSTACYGLFLEAKPWWAVRPRMFSA